MHRFFFLRISRPCQEKKYLRAQTFSTQMCTERPTTIDVCQGMYVFFLLLTFVSVHESEHIVPSDQ